MFDFQFGFLLFFLIGAKKALSKLCLVKLCFVFFCFIFGHMFVGSNFLFFWSMFDFCLVHFIFWFVICPIKYVWSVVVIVVVFVRALFCFLFVWLLCLELRTQSIECFVLSQLTKFSFDCLGCLSIVSSFFVCILVYVWFIINP